MRVVVVQMRVAAGRSTSRAHCDWNRRSGHVVRMGLQFNILSLFVACLSKGTVYNKKTKQNKNRQINITLLGTSLWRTTPTNHHFCFAESDSTGTAVSINMINGANIYSSTTISE